MKRFRCNFLAWVCGVIPVEKRKGVKRQDAREMKRINRERRAGREPRAISEHPQDEHLPKRLPYPQVQEKKKKFTIDLARSPSYPL